MSVVFDRLSFVKRLKDAGTTRPHAKAMSEAFHSAMLESVATKGDLDMLRREMRDEFNLVRRDAETTKSSLQTEIGQVRIAVAETKVWTVGVGATIVAVLAAMKYVG